MSYIFRKKVLPFALSTCVIAVSSLPASAADNATRRDQLIQAVVQRDSLRSYDLAADLRFDSDPWLKTEAALALVRLAVNANRSVRLQIIESLGILGVSEPAAVSLLEAIMQYGSAEEKYRAVAALSRLEPRVPAVTALLRQAAKSSEEPIASRASRALLQTSLEAEGEQ